MSVPSPSPVRPQPIVQTSLPVPPIAQSTVQASAFQEDIVLTDEFNPAAISDAQIDPALLEAVVTVLRHVDETQMAAAEAGIGFTLNRAQEEGDPLSHNQGGDACNAGPSQPARARRKRSAAGTEGGTSQTSRRRRSSARSTEAGEEDGSGYVRQKKRVRRSRVPSPPPFDPNADPGEEIDPTAVTMAELCDDLGRGRVSSKAAQIVSNHATWRAMNREKRARQRAIAEAKKFGRNLEEEENNTSQPSDTISAESGLTQPTKSSESATSADAEAEDDDGGKGEDYDYTQAMATSRFNVQVRIGANGETVIDETSLFVDRQEEDETANYTHIEESDTSKFVNSSTYSKKLRGSRWSAEETELFYDVRT